jgi:hypothetical protein
LLAIVALLGLLLTASAVQAARPTNGFNGHWAGPDPGDGSNLDVYIVGGDQVQMLYTDDEATSACAGRADQAWTAFLTGTVEGNDLNSTIRWAKCGRTPSGAGFNITWTLNDRGDGDASNDSLTNHFGEIYARVP